MSKQHNYTQYSNKKNDNHKSNAKPSTDRKVDVQAEIDKPIPEIKLAKETVDTVAIPTIVEGTVVNCAKLNVREEPNTYAEIVCVLDAMSEIEIDLTKSTEDWFKVCTAIGVEGYCMRKFVNAHM